MKAAICTRYGPPDVVKVQDVPKPIPKANEVLIRIHAACVNSGDARIRGFKVPSGMGVMLWVGVGVLRPRAPILGIDLAGVVEAVGADVSHYKPGDDVFAIPGFGTGTHAEYVSMPENGAIAKKPTGLSMGEAASLLFGGTTAISFLQRDANLQPGERILINGASGAVGCASIQLAKHLGAHVTAVASAANADLLTRLGADVTVDYTSKTVPPPSETYDVIMDNVGTLPWSKAKDSLTPTGRHLGVVSSLPGMIAAGLRPKRDGRRLFAGIAGSSHRMLAFLGDLAETGELQPVIDRTFSLDQIAEAHAYVDKGRKVGSVVIDMNVSPA